MIRYIKEDSQYFYVVTERGQTASMSKNHARLVNSNSRTWTIERWGYAYTYDEKCNLIESHKY